MRPKAPWTDFVRSLPSTLSIAEMAAQGRTSGFPDLTNAQVYSVRKAADLEFKHVLPSRKGIVYKSKKGKPASKKFKAKNGHQLPKVEPKTAAEAMALIREHKAATANQGPSRADMESVMRKVVLRYGTEHIRAFLDRLEDSD